MTLLVFTLAAFLCSAACFAAERPASWPSDCIPKSWSESKIDWKGTWDATLAANGDTNALRRDVEQNPELRAAADRIPKLREITLLRELIGHFPGDKAKHAAAYREMAELYAALDERPRALDCLAQLVNAFPDRKDIAADAYAGILRYAHPFDAVPDAQAWVAYAARGVEALEKAGALARDHLAADLARRHSCLVLVHEGRYVETRRLLDRSRATESGQSWWQAERASLLETVGHLSQAADCYEKAGNKAMAEKLRVLVRPGLADGLTRRTPLELEMRWKVLRERGQQPGGPLPADPAVIHEAVKLSAETGVMQGEEPLLRQSLWSAIDQLLRSAKPADLLPLRELQESKVGAVAGEIRRMGDADEAVRLFRRYPWARSAQALLAEFAEDALRNGRFNWAARAFQDVLTHADDAQLLAQARVGSWLALAGLPDWREDLERAMSAVPDDAMLPWRVGQAKAAEIKAAIRIPAPAAGSAAPSALASLRRAKVPLPAALAAVEPVAPNRQFVSPGLGPWTIRRIEAAGDLFAVIGSRHVACYDFPAMKLRRLCSAPALPENPVIEEQRAADAASSAPSWVEPAWRPAVLGRSWSSAIGGRESPAVYSIITGNHGETLEYDVAAWDPGSGRMLWSTGHREEWNDLQPQSEPAAGEGCLYVLAAAREAAKSRPLYLVCLDGGSGAIAWQRLLGALPADDRLRELALGGSAITLHQGALYVSTDAGIVARCDARDGTVEWVRAYPSALMGERAAIQYLREGPAPLAAAGRIFIAPRDHTGVMALDSATGRLLWENLLVPSDRIAGVAGQVLVTQGRDGLAALDLASGAEVWATTFDDARRPRAVVAGAHVLVVAGDRLLRFLAATGAVVDELRLNGGAGAEFAMLADGSLAEFVEETLPDPIEKQGSIAGPLRLPLAEQWALPCERPLLVTGPARGAGTNTSGVLSGRLLLCVEAQPRGRIVWQSRLRGRPDSVGFHGNLVLTACDRTLTALNAATGATDWVLRLPCRIDLVGGDERVLYAGELTQAGAVVAVEPGTGKILWQRWFGKENRLASGKLEWIGLQGDAAGSPSLHLYWNAALFGNEGNRPAELVVDAASGVVRDVRRFLPGEPQWPPQIAFGDDVRLYTGRPPLPPWPRRGPFRPDATAYVGEGALAHFALLKDAQNLAGGWNQAMDVKPQDQYWSSVGLHPTADGPFVRRIGQLVFYDVSTATGIVYALPRNISTRTAYNILDFRADADAVTVVSGSERAVPEVPQPFLWDGLQDCTGRGDVVLKCFKGQVQLGHSTMQLPEAGSNPTATLLNGQIKQHYQDSCIRMSNISSLGWSTYDVYFYGFSGTAAIDGVGTQKCAGADYSKAIHRTTFVPGANYLKFAGLSGDAFTLDFSQSSFSAIQIVNASPNASKEKPEGLGVNWTGGGPALLPTDVVGAEVACGNWYNINNYNLISGGLTNKEAARTVMSVDVFDRATGSFAGTQALPGVQPGAQGTGYKSQAKLLGGGLLTTEAGGVHFLRTGRADGGR